MKKAIIPIIILILLSVSCFAESISFLGTFKQGDEINLIQICANCTYVNISSITSPDSNVIISDVEMTKVGVKFNYTLAPQDTLGSYNVCGFGDLDAKKTVWCYSFDVTPGGKMQTNNDTTLTLSIFSALFILIGFFLLFRNEKELK